MSGDVGLREGNRAVALAIGLVKPWRRVFVSDVFRRVLLKSIKTLDRPSEGETLTCEVLCADRVAGTCIVLMFASRLPNAYEKKDESRERGVDT